MIGLLVVLITLWIFAVLSMVAGNPTAVNAVVGLVPCIAVVALIVWIERTL